MNKKFKKMLIKHSSQIKVTNDLRKSYNNIHHKLRLHILNGKDGYTQIQKVSCFCEPRNFYEKSINWHLVGYFLQCLNFFFSSYIIL